MPQRKLNPRTVAALKQVGEQVRLARLRRNMSAEELACKADVSRKTLWNIERGDPGVSIGNIARVLNAMSLRDELLNIAKDDVMGRTFQDMNLTVGRRKRKS